jgi:hypothetical protein
VYRTLFHERSGLVGIEEQFTVQMQQGSSGRGGVHAGTARCGRWTIPAAAPKVSYGSALIKALTKVAELSEASWRKVPISFSPLPPPARSDRLRKAMKGVLLA